MRVRLFFDVLLCRFALSECSSFVSLLYIVSPVGACYIHTICKSVRRPRKVGPRLQAELLFHFFRVRFMHAARRDTSQAAVAIATAIPSHVVEYSMRDASP